MKRIRTINPLTALTVMMMVVLGFSAISVGLTNLNTLDTRNLLTKANDTITNTRDILQSGNRTRAIIDELRETGRLAEESRQNQTASLLPIFFKQFNQTDIMANQTAEMLNATEAMLNATKQMQHFIDFIGTSFDDEYLIDEVRQYGQSNSTEKNITLIQDKLDAIMEALNSSSTSTSS